MPDLARSEQGFGASRFPISDRKRVAEILRRNVQDEASPYLVPRKRERVRGDGTRTRGTGLESDGWEKRTERRVRLARKLSTARSCGEDPNTFLVPSTTEVIQDVASEWGVSFATLYRLLSEGAPAMSWRTLSLLTHRVRAEDQEALRIAALPAHVVEWKEHVEEETERFQHARGRRPEQDILFPPSDKKQREAWERREILPGDRRELVSRKESLLWEGFRRYVARRLVPEARALLGRYRVYDALASWAPLRTAMSPKERLKVVIAGWRREQALLSAEVRFLRATQPTRAN